VCPELAKLITIVELTCFPPSFLEYPLQIDLGFPSQLSATQKDIEFHATLFTSNSSAPTTTTMNSVGWTNSSTATGGSCNTITTKTSPSGLATSGANAAYNQNFKFNSSFANEFHTYKVIWTPTSLAWYVDTTQLLTIDYAIWLPQTLRFILRTNTAPCVDDVSQTGVKCAAIPKANGGPFVAGVAPTVATAKPDGEVVVKEIRWTPLTAAATVVADAKMYKSIGDKCATRGCADPYGPAGVAKATPSPPPPYAAAVSSTVTVTTSSVYIVGSYTKATFGATQQSQLATAIANSVKVAASAVKVLSVVDVGVTAGHRRRLSSTTIEATFTISSTAASSDALESALAAAWESNADPEALLTAAGLSGAADATLNAAPKTVAPTADVGTGPDVSAQVSAEYIVFSAAMLIVVAMGGGACMQRVRGGEENQKR
jgi:hypothetical protein